MNDQSPFEPRIVVALVAVAIALFAASLLLAGSSERHEAGNRVGANTYSNSAVGHLGLFDVLKKLDYETVRGEREVLALLGRNGILVLAEPTRSVSGGGSGDNLLGAEKILVVLPKWDVQRNAEHDGWIGSAQLIPESTARIVLYSVAGAGDIVRRESPPTFKTSLSIPVPTIERQVQLIKGSRLKPIVSADGGILLGELKEGQRTIWVLADPDPFENHGFGKGDNLAFAATIFYRMLADKPGALVFDETLHGFRHTAPSVLSFLLEFPYNLIALQIVFSVVLLLMASTARFGKPELPDRALQTGKRDLISNAAVLLDHAGHHASVLRRYVGMVVQDMGRMLRAPAGLSDDELAAWLDKTAARRGLRTGCAAAIARVAAASQDPAPLLGEARTIHHLRKDMLHGISGRLGDH
ncbi:hypothetical protein SSBR45G_06830 [Bradyrhizobium sp. SSBR45G]|uniref:DUF4350 domain-containing protein n=1 Tax=unclassified Bradyrhizobium TaxID=2631580 RepID=UPI0023429872|nr:MULTISPECIES: DUF4350 domain-containing protein [unclassified Bradyrhizobium]GLH75775.1 hypothetical protein SSBR45G_06830 [Bradyrhizobium sp. SSBR45G]GLH85659.1 hypothetical protein SSBR45R_31190 [Bradyrhizobium sp. SSBR45R]